MEKKGKEGNHSFKYLLPLSFSGGGERERRNEKMVGKYLAFGRAFLGRVGRDEWPSE